MTGIAARIEARSFDALADDQAHGLGGEGFGRDAPVFIDPTKHRPVFDPPSGKPLVERGHGTLLRPPERDADLAAYALLIVLGPAERDDYPLAHALDVSAVECDQLGPPEPAREADKKQRPVADVPHALSHRRQDGEEVIS